jgi:hypothetical protein
VIITGPFIGGRLPALAGRYDPPPGADAVVDPSVDFRLVIGDTIFADRDALGKFTALLEAPAMGIAERDAFRNFGAGDQTPRRLGLWHRKTSGLID